MLGKGTKKGVVATVFFLGNSLAKQRLRDVVKHGQFCVFGRGIQLAKVAARPNVQPANSAQTAFWRGSARGTPQLSRARTRQARRDTSQTKTRNWVRLGVADTFVRKSCGSRNRHLCIFPTRFIWAIFETAGANSGARLQFWESWPKWKRQKTGNLRAIGQRMLSPLGCLCDSLSPQIAPAR